MAEEGDRRSGILLSPAKETMFRVKSCCFFYLDLNVVDHFGKSAAQIIQIETAEIVSARDSQSLKNDRSSMYHHVSRVSTG